MLHACTAVEIEVFVDLTFAASRRGLIDWEFDAPTPALHHLGHECGIFCRDVLVVERHELLKAEHFAIELDPLVHFAEFDVANDVIDSQQPGGVICRGIVPRRIDRAKTWSKFPLVVVSIYKGVRSVAVCADRGKFIDSVLVFKLCRPFYSVSASLDGQVLGHSDVIDLQRDIRNAVAM